MKMKIFYLTKAIERKLLSVFPFHENRINIVFFI